MNTCKTCKHWKPSDSVYWEVSAGGECQSKSITENNGLNAYAANRLVYSYEEGGSFWTGPDFGCVHHDAAGRTT